jgi:hypothetical protein
MEKSSQITWKIVPLRHFFPLKVVPLIEVFLYLHVVHIVRKDEWNQNYACHRSLSVFLSAVTSLLSRDGSTEPRRIHNFKILIIDYICRVSSDRPTRANKQISWPGTSNNRRIRRRPAKTRSSCWVSINTSWLQPSSSWVLSSTSNPTHCRILINWSEIQRV